MHTCNFQRDNVNPRLLMFLLFLLLSSAAMVEADEDPNAKLQEDNQEDLISLLHKDTSTYQHPVRDSSSDKNLYHKEKYNNSEETVDGKNEMDSIQKTIHIREDNYGGTSKTKVQNMSVKESENNFFLNVIAKNNAVGKNAENYQIFKTELNHFTDSKTIFKRQVNDLSEISDQINATDVEQNESYPLRVPKDAEDSANSVDEESWNDYIDKLFNPEFDPQVQANISAVEGQTVHMGCRVNNLGTKTVSWIRHRDTHILTVGSSTYTSDHRFSTLHRQGTNEWTLQLRDPTKADAGLYECQVSTKPVRAHVVNLRVVVPWAEILSGPEIYIEEGSRLQLICIVTPTPAPPEFIFWYHRGEVINYEKDKRVLVSVRQIGSRTTCSLTVEKAALEHSGSYRCSPSNAHPANIMVHISKAEEPAAMQTSFSGPRVRGSIPITILCAILVTKSAFSLALFRLFILLTYILPYLPINLNILPFKIAFFKLVNCSDFKTVLYRFKFALTKR